MKKQGYKEMLRDRCPEVVNFALKWCKAKERWINHVYDCFVRIVGDEVSENGTIKSTKKDNKKQVTRVLLGLKKGKPRFFDFHKTIDWENLTDEEQFYWNWVDNWVKWFSVNYAYIENMYSISRKTGKYEEDSFIEEMSTKYFPDYDDDEGKRLAKFLISCIEGNTKLIMYGVFSNYLVSRYSRRNESTIESALDHMRELTTAKSKFEYDPVLSDHHVVCISPLTKDEYFTDCDYIYECLTNHHLMLLIRWINKNIVLRCSESVYSTNVRLRIATCMLNKLEEANFVSKRHALWFHEILVANIADLRNSLLDDMLPFLQYRGYRQFMLSQERNLISPLKQLVSEHRYVRLITTLVYLAYCLFDYENPTYYPRGDWDNQKSPSR